MLEADLTPIPHIAHLSEAPGSAAFWHGGAGCDLAFVRRGPVLLVTFDNLATIDERDEARPWPIWQDRRAATLGLSVLGIQSHQKDWYRNAATPVLIEGLRAAGFFDGFDRVLFTGASMGGFAAMVYAHLVPGARVLAFSPQSTLSRKIAPFETRYPYVQRRFDWDSPAYLDAADYVGRAAGGHLFYDPFVPEDRAHVDRLPAGALEAVKIPHAGHLLVRVVAKAGALDVLMNACAHHEDLPAEFWTAMRNRRDNRAWARRFLSQAETRGDGPLLRRACTALGDYRFARLTLRRLKDEQAC